jgi:autoinducer 2-degrading protein
MHIVLVHIHVKAEAIEVFMKATLENARQSRNEPGVERFDFFQQTKDPTYFSLIEIYHSPSDQLLHRETKHYQTWKDAVGNMMAEPRHGIAYRNLFPSDDDWK